MFAEQGPEIWIGTYGNGISCLDIEKNKFRNLFQNDKDPTTISSSLIYSFYRTRDGYLWACTEGGLNKINTKTYKVEGRYFTIWDEAEKGEKYSRTHRTSKMWEDEKSNFWVSVIGGGLMYVNTKTWDFERFRFKESDSTTISDNRIFDMVYDKINNALWLATYNGGLCEFNLKTRKVKRHIFNKKRPQGLSSNWCVSLKIDSLTKMLWIATEGGLNGIDLKAYSADRKNPVFFHYTQNEGLLDNTVLSVLPDGRGNLWLSTEKAIYHYYPPRKVHGTLDEKDHPNGLIKIYNKANGIPLNSSSPLAAVYSPFDKRVYFGDAGLCAFNPDSVFENKIMPKVYITSIKLFDKYIYGDTAAFETKTLTLKYNQNFLSFSFAAPGYFFPENNRLAYKLEGVEEKWNYCGLKNGVDYTNLDPGEYIFRVKAANNDGYWNEKGAVVFITISPPFWKTKWFYVLVAVLFLLTIYLVIRFRERKLKKEKIILEEKVSLRTRELKEEKEKVELQKNIIEEKQKEIVDSIRYAKRIQKAHLPTDNYIVKVMDRFRKK